jgi:hypothetical protein
MNSSRLNDDFPYNDYDEYDHDNDDGDGDDNDDNVTAMVSIIMMMMMIIIIACFSSTIFTIHDHNNMLYLYFLQSDDSDRPMMESIMSMHSLALDSSLGEVLYS